MFTVQTLGLVETILLGVLIGIPLGAFAIRKLDPETFRRVCMSFDVWIVGFGLSKVLIDLKLAQGAGAYSVMLAAILIDAILLYVFFSRNVSLRRNRPAAG
jgi:mannitol-specific phosphotransferase system IIBC component